MHIDKINLPPRTSTVVGAFNAKIFLTDEREYGAHTALYITMPSISSREQASETAVAKKRKKNCSRQKNYGRNWSHQTSARRGKCRGELRVAAIPRICDVYDSSSFALKFEPVKSFNIIKGSSPIFFVRWKFFNKVIDPLEKKVRAYF